MKLGEKISRLRREKNLTQEQFADLLCVSRQSVSKWESDTAYPETAKLIRIGELFGCSLDYLLKEDMEKETAEKSVTSGMENAPDISVTLKSGIRERKSDKQILGMPAWHIGKNARGFLAVGLNARGVIAIGLRAKGLVSLGVLSMGLLSMGILSLGILSLGLLALGIFSAGTIAAGILSAGSISFGIVSVGAIAAGDFAVGALSIGKYLAIGDNARAMIAVGDTQAAGTVFQKIGTLNAAECETVKALLEDHVPAYLHWAEKLAEYFLLHT